MTDRQRAQLVLHGGVLILFALATGLLAVTEAPVASERTWRSMHQTLLIFGIWLLATAGLGPVLRLGTREARALVWCLVSGGSSMAVTLSVRAMTGVSGFAPGGSAASWVAFVSNMAVVLASALAAMLTITGAWAAYRAASDRELH